MAGGPGIGRLLEGRSLVKDLSLGPFHAANEFCARSCFKGSEPQCREGMWLPSRERAPLGGGRAEAAWVVAVPSPVGLMGVTFLPDSQSQCCSFLFLTLYL